MIDDKNKIIKLNYKPEYINYFENFERINQEKIINDYINKLSTSILLRIIKYYFSSDRINSYQIYISTKPVIFYLIYRLKKLSSLSSQHWQTILNSTPITKESLENYFVDNTSLFSINCSPNMCDECQNDIPDKSDNNDDYYNVVCSGDTTLKYVCKSHKIVYKPFFSYGDEIHHNVPFSVLHNPVIYYHTSKETITILLENNYILFIHRLVNNHRRYLYPPFENIFEMLMTTNIREIVENSKPFPKKTINVNIPYMNNIFSDFHNMHKIIENIDKYDQLFINKKCKLFNFQSQSYLFNNNYNDNNNNSNNKDTMNININVPFLYLILDENYIIESGGLYDYQPNLINSANYFYDTKCF